MKKYYLCFGITLAVILGLAACSNMGQEKIESVAEEKVDETEVSFELQSVKYRSLVFSADESPDLILEAYRSSMFHDKVIAFFGVIVHSNELAEVILKEASQYNVSPSLAFALSWEESRFNQKAINKNWNNTIDRGLFQLNSGSFPQLKEADFFDPGTNTHHAMAHLRWCLDYAESEVAGLAMYNAGLNRVKTGGTPKKTLDYVSRILRSSKNMEELFLEELSTWETIAEAEKEESKPITLIPMDSLALAWAGILSTYP